MADLRRSLLENAELLAVGVLVLFLSGAPMRVLLSTVSRIQPHPEIQMLEPTNPAGRVEMRVQQLSEHLEQRAQLLERRSELILLRHQEAVGQLAGRIANQPCPFQRAISRFEGR